MDKNLMRSIMCLLTFSVLLSGCATNTKLSAPEVESLDSEPLNFETPSEEYARLNLATDQCNGVRAVQLKEVMQQNGPVRIVPSSYGDLYLQPGSYQLRGHCMSYQDETGCHPNTDTAARTTVLVQAMQEYQLRCSNDGFVVVETTASTPSAAQTTNVQKSVICPGGAPSWRICHEQAFKACNGRYTIDSQLSDAGSKSGNSSSLHKASVVQRTMNVTCESGG